MPNAGGTVRATPPKIALAETKSPQEMLDDALEQINAKLADDLMEDECREKRSG